MSASDLISMAFKLCRLICLQLPIYQILRRNFCGAAIRKTMSIRFWAGICCESWKQMNHRFIDSSVHCNIYYVDNIGTLILRSKYLNLGGDETCIDLKN